MISQGYIKLITSIDNLCICALILRSDKTCNRIAYMTLKPKGGRGKQAPYKTKTMRIPLPLVDQIQDLINDYRNELFKDDTTINNSPNELRSQ